MDGLIDLHFLISLHIQVTKVLKPRTIDQGRQILHMAELFDSPFPFIDIDHRAPILPAKVLGVADSDPIDLLPRYHDEIIPDQHT